MTLKSNFTLESTRLNFPDPILMPTTILIIEKTFRPAIARFSLFFERTYIYVFVYRKRKKERKKKEWFNNDSTR